ncbi:cysteine desulfurase family protein [Rickettsia endosymbiont of Halotydeus destructor]|uniref:cysteine desulfurase family protein n=1 Tax=Rickettsia endosymbiont of Halotydeus destructor TaxID=2996754 RepID=UPI003BB05D6C
MLYLDHNATSFTEPKVKELMLSLMEGGLNPSSIHTQGRLGKKIIEKAREQIANSVGIVINLREYEIIFTSSGTESNNLIMKNYYDGDIFIAAIEHLSIYTHIKYAPNIKIIKVDNEGIINLEELEKLLSQSNNNKKLVSIMLANNETGVIQDIAAISKITKKYGAALHSDCVQGLGRIPINIKSLGLDFCTISGHKIGAGFGSSALIASSKNSLTPLTIGGGQEKNMRSGTENVLAIACFGLAAEIVTTEIADRCKKMKELQELLEKYLSKYKNVKIIGQSVLRLPNTSLIIVPKTDAQTKLIAFDLRGVYVSSGSACSSGKVSKSHVLNAMGLNEDEISSSIRISLSHNQTQQDIKIFIEAFEEIYNQELI